MSEKDENVKLKRHDLTCETGEEEAYIIIKGKKIKPFYNKEDEVPEELKEIIERAVLEMYDQNDGDESLYVTDPDSAEAQDLKDEEK